MVEGPETDLAAARFELPDQVVMRRFAKETVVLNLETGGYHGLNATAHRMLEVLAAGATVGECAAQLAQEYDAEPAEIEAGARRLCEELVERGLLQVRSGAAG